MKYFYFLVRLFVVFVFFLSGALKLLDPGRFLLDIQVFDVLPIGTGCAIAVFLPCLEIFAALALLFKRFYAGALTILVCMSMFFTVLITWVDWKGLELNCGCFGDWLVFPDFYTHLGFNSLLLASLVMLLLQLFDVSETS